LNTFNRAMICAALVLSAVCAASSPANADAKRIMVFGDSNSWAWHPVPEIAPVVRYPQDVAWPGVMAKDLGDGFEVINESLSARTAVVTDKSVDKGLGLSGAGLSGAEYLPAAIATNMPLDLVIIMLGTNDVKPVYNRTALQVSLDVMSLVAEAQKDTGVATSYPAPKVLVVVPPHLGKIANVDWVQAMFPQASVVESGQIAEYLCPLAESVKVLCFDGGSVAEITGPDGIHMTPENHKKLGDAVAAEVLKILQ